MELVEMQTAISAQDGLSVAKPLISWQSLSGCSMMALAGCGHYQ